MANGMKGDSYGHQSGNCFAAGGTIPQSLETYRKSSKKNLVNLNKNLPVPVRMQRRCSFLAAPACTHTGSGDGNLLNLK